MGDFCYQVVKHQRGWAYRLERTYSRIFPTQWEATAAAKAAAIKMHESGDRTQVRVQDGTLSWRTELVIDRSLGPQPSAHRELLKDRDEGAAPATGVT